MTSSFRKQIKMSFTKKAFHLGSDKKILSDNIELCLCDEKNVQSFIWEKNSVISLMVCGKETLFNLVASFSVFRI